MRLYLSTRLRRPLGPFRWWRGLLFLCLPRRLIKARFFGLEFWPKRFIFLRLTGIIAAMENA